jgi:hypothetical protein
MPAPSTPDHPKRAAMELASGAITRFFRCLARRAAFHPTKSGRQLKASKTIATISGYIVLCPICFQKMVLFQKNGFASNGYAGRARRSSIRRSRLLRFFDPKRLAL